jgi:hypothetical protein
MFNFKVNDTYYLFILIRIRKFGKKGLRKIGKLVFFTGQYEIYFFFTAVTGLLSFQRQRYRQAYVR